MLTTLIVTALLCLTSLGVILVIPHFAKTKFLVLFPPGYPGSGQESSGSQPGKTRDRLFAHAGDGRAVPWRLSFPGRGRPAPELRLLAAVGGGT